MRRKTFWIAASCILAVFSLLPAFSSGEAPAGYKVIYSFTGGNDGGAPLSDLTADAAGNLYGTTSIGGTGSGTVFELHRAKDGWKEEVLYNFGSFQGDGGYPQGGVIFDGAGDLYGTTAHGGSNGNDAGTVFKLSRKLNGGWTETILHSFTGVNGDGANPQTDLTFDEHGNLYGTTLYGGSGGSNGACSGYYKTNCGTVFELTLHPDGSWTEATIYSFTGAPDGALPSSAVVPDASGNLYGLTEAGGMGKCLFVTSFPGCGIAYELTPISDGKWTESIIYDFQRGRGFAVNPSGGLVFDDAGHLFGTTQEGGNGLGALFELTQSQTGWQQHVLYRFYGNPDGIRSVGRLWIDAEGDLFGVTKYGGVSRFDGIVFEVKRSRDGEWKETVLHGFAGDSDGSSPQAGLVSDSHGDLYGTTQQGGSGTACNGGCGTIYEVRP